MAVVLVVAVVWASVTASTVRSNADARIAGINRKYAAQGAALAAAQKAAANQRTIAANVTMALLAEQQALQALQADYSRLTGRPPPVADPSTTTTAPTGGATAPSTTTTTTRAQGPTSSRTTSTRSTTSSATPPTVIVVPVPSPATTVPAPTTTTTSPGLLSGLLHGLL